jgi:acyl carrier protein
MAVNEVQQGLVEILGAVAHVDPGDITAERSIAEDLGIDSMTLTEVVVAAEDRFGVLIPDDEWSGFRTVGDAVRCIQRLSVAPA